MPPHGQPRIPGVNPPPPTPTTPTDPRPFPAPLLLVLALLALGFTPAIPLLADSHGTAIRSLPDSFQDLVPFRVRLEITPPTHTAVQSIQQSFPPGWSVSDINYGGTVDTAHQRVKWGPFTDDLRRTLTFTLLAPLDATPSPNFTGTAVFGSVARPVDGPSQLPKQTGSARRRLPAHYLPDQPIEVRIELRPGHSTLAWALQESLPPGWQPVDLPHESSYDPTTHSLKWGPFLTPDPRELRYRLRPHVSSRTTAVFQGIALFEALATPVQGDQSLPLQPHGLSRTLPPRFLPHQSARIQIRTEPAPYGNAYSVEEDIPAELIVGSISHDGVWDPNHRRIKWGPFTDTLNRILDYEILTPAQPASSYAFHGRSQFDAHPQSITGPNLWESATPASPASLLADYPGLFLPGQELRIRLLAEPSPAIRIHAYEIPIPDHWTFVRATDGGTFDALRRRIKWGPFHDPAPRTLAADLIPNPASAVPATLRAIGWFDQTELVARGELTIAPTPSRALRVLPTRFTPGQAFLVQIELIPAPGLAFATLEELLPDNVTVTDISDGGVWDATRSKVKWGPFPGPTRRTLTYRVHPGSDSRGTAPFAGTAIFDSLPTTLEGDARVLLNHGPLPQPDVLQRPPARTAKISVVELLANDSDTDGDGLRLVHVEPISARGARMQILGPWLFYESPSDPGTEDQFAYTVEDPFGSRSVSSATLVFAHQTVSSRLSVISATPVSPGVSRVRFVAVPGSLCRVEVSTDLRTWAFLVEAPTDAFGVGEILDHHATSSPARFYRLSLR